MSITVIKPFIQHVCFLCERSFKSFHRKRPNFRRCFIICFVLVLSSYILASWVYGSTPYSGQTRTQNQKRHAADLPLGDVVLSYPFASNIIVSEINRFIFCPIPKAANSNWKFLVRKFEGFRDYADLAKAHDRNLSGLRYLSDYSPREVHLLLNDQSYFKFVFVRNPFRRLVSCYMDKFLNTKPAYVKTEYRIFLAQLFSWHYATSIDIDNDPRPSFRAFIDELTKQTPAEMNAHWMPQTIHCGIGIVKYDFIGRMERLLTDVEHVLKTLNKSGERFPTHDDIGFPPSGATHAELSRLYEPDLIAKVRAIYDTDFALLKYDACENAVDNIICLG